MKLTKLNWELESVSDTNTTKQLVKMHGLLDDLAERELTDEVVNLLNTEIEKLNETTLKDLGKALTKSYRMCTKVLYEKLRLVPIAYYQSLWMSLGMAAFGIPLGVAFSASLNNYAYIGIGLPIGLVLGLAVGRKKDKDAKKERLQLNVNM